MHLSGKYFNYNNQSSAIWGLFFAQVELTPDRRRMGGPRYSTQYNRLSHHHFLQAGVHGRSRSLSMWRSYPTACCQTRRWARFTPGFFMKKRFASSNPSPTNTTAFTSTVCSTPWRRSRAA